jgi:hypothetical protein
MLVSGAGLDYFFALIQPVTDIALSGPTILFSGELA